MQLIKIETVALHLVCSDDQVRKHITSGELVAVNIGSGTQRRCIRVTDDSLRAFIKRRTIAQSQKRRRRSKSLSKPQRDWV